MYVAFWSVTGERRRFKGTSAEPTVNSPLGSTIGECRSPSWKQRSLSLRYVVCRPAYIWGSGVGLSRIWLGLD